MGLQVVGQLHFLGCFAVLLKEITVPVFELEA